MRSSFLAFACVVAACTPGAPPGFAGAVVELSHRVKVRSFDANARLEVSRQFHNDTDEVQTLSRVVSLPKGAIATSLRVARGTEAPVRAPLSTEERVTADWERLTGPGDAEPALIGKLDWALDDELRLELFGLPPHETVTVGYDVSVEPTYSAGVLTFTYPRQDDAVVTPEFERADVDETDEGFVVHRQQFTDAIADVRWATAPVDTDRTLWRLELDVAAQLTPVPVAPHVVFVLDASFSQGPNGIEKQLELLAPYLANTPDARVEVVVARRFAERLFGTFVAVEDVPTLLERNAHRLALGNGSNLDDGAALAASALSGVAGPARIVLFSDGRLRRAFSTDATREALARAPRDTVVHVVDRFAPSRRALEVRRNDDGPLDALVEPSGGLAVIVVGAVGDGATKELASLVHPTRLDALQVDAPGLDLATEDWLEQGATLRLKGVAARPPAFVTVTGKLWRREFRKVVGEDDGLARRLPAMAVGEPELRLALSDDELRSVAFLSQAVSPVTSYLAVPPGAAASRAGSPFWSGDLGHLGGGVSFSTTCGLGGWRRAVDLEAQLEQLLAPARAACEARLGVKSTAQVRVEVTNDEIVDVEVLRENVTMAACLREAAWAIRLGQQFIGTSRSLWVEFRGE